jgi:GTP-binding protein
MSVQIINASFLTSAPTKKETPAGDVSEVLFIGRSNVGKSSLLNSLTNRKDLAKKSSTPGKTKLINFFDIIFKKEEDRFIARFVDLPGFGYAKVSKEQKKDWEKNLTDFLLDRVSVRLFIHLVDARHTNLEIDINTQAFLQSIKRPDQEVITVYTKTDKLRQSDLSKLKKANEGALFISNLKKRGLEQLRAKIFTVLFGEI